MNHEKIIAKIEALAVAPIAFQAQWDGDSRGWFIYFEAITADGKSHHLEVFSRGGDIRLFNGQVPPWPEATAARGLGEELAERYSAEFYFPSPDHPEVDCPDWKDREKGYPCRRCGILLLQSPNCRWYGVCYYCHLDEERERREAQWTPEQRRSPRCHICGDPAVNELNGGPVCAGCFEKYEVSHCEKCNCPRMGPKSSNRSSFCRRCRLQNAVDSLKTVQHETIRDAAKKGYLEGMRVVMDALSCSPPDSEYILNLLGYPDTANRSA